MTLAAHASKRTKEIILHETPKPRDVDKPTVGTMHSKIGINGFRRRLTWA